MYSPQPSTPTTQQWGPAKVLTIIGMVAGSLFGAGMAYSQLAGKDYVDTRVKTFDQQMIELAKAQTTTANQVGTLANRADKTDKDMDTIVKLVKIQFIEQVDERESRSSRVRKRPRSAKSRRVAELLQVDPDDPMAGIELLEATP